MNEEPIDVRPYAYYTVMRQAQDPKALRLRMAIHAKQHGVTRAVNAFKTTKYDADAAVNPVGGTVRENPIGDE